MAGSDNSSKLGVICDEKFNGDGTETIAFKPCEQAMLPLIHPLATEESDVFQDIEDTALGLPAEAHGDATFRGNRDDLHMAYLDMQYEDPFGSIKQSPGSQDKATEPKVELEVTPDVDTEQGSSVPSQKPNGINSCTNYKDNTENSVFIHSKAQSQSNPYQPTEAQSKTSFQPSEVPSRSSSYQPAELLTRNSYLPPEAQTRNSYMPSEAQAVRITPIISSQEPTCVTDKPLLNPVMNHVYESMENPMRTNAEMNKHRESQIRYNDNAQQLIRESQVGAPPDPTTLGPPISERTDSVTLMFNDGSERTIKTGENNRQTKKRKYGSSSTHDEEHMMTNMLDTQKEIRDLLKCLVEASQQSSQAQQATAAALREASDAQLRSALALEKIALQIQSSVPR
ncbi:uncharacterized protein LOC108676693 isoform X2 [Hyalella azteca]|uniref:Uncharacterized protein LOC108676693 isoform X2 n=1 Tax=Hyalella azteca TaxID=294128 RepID=A0A979FNE4_HYAAZ|nr:uncharacterized protein LOC108676693 isoform X2 [Hyalella azteca]